MCSNRTKQGCGSQLASTSLLYDAPILTKLQIMVQKFGCFERKFYLCTDKLVLLTLNRMLMKQKKAKLCEKSVQLFGGVELFTYFCR